MVDAATAFGIGLLLIVGGRQHTQAAAWDVVNANGGPVAWGAVVLALGAALLVATALGARYVVIALWALALFYVVLGIAFAVAAWRDPEQGASYIGSMFTLRASIMHLSRAQAYREGPRQWTG